jgi:hypothetical protein
MDSSTLSTIPPSSPAPRSHTFLSVGMQPTSPALRRAASSPMMPRSPGFAPPPPSASASGSSSLSPGLFRANSTGNMRDGDSSSSSSSSSSSRLQRPRPEVTFESGSSSSSSSNNQEGSGDLLFVTPRGPGKRGGVGTSPRASSAAAGRRPAGTSPSKGGAGGAGISQASHLPTNLILTTIEPSIKRMFRDVLKARAALLTVVLGTQVTYQHLTAGGGGEEGGAAAAASAVATPGGPPSSTTKGTPRRGGGGGGGGNDLVSPTRSTSPPSAAAPSSSSSVFGQLAGFRTADGTLTSSPSFAEVSAAAVAFDKARLEDLVLQALHAQEARWKDQAETIFHNAKQAALEALQPNIDRFEEDRRRLLYEKATVEAEKGVLVRDLVRLKSVVQGMKEPFLWVPPGERELSEARMAEALSAGAEQTVRERRRRPEDSVGDAARQVEDALDAARAPPPTYADGFAAWGGSGGGQMPVSRPGSTGGPRRGPQSAAAGTPRLGAGAGAGAGGSGSEADNETSTEAVLAAGGALMSLEAAAATGALTPQTTRWVPGPQGPQLLMTAAQQAQASLNSAAIQELRGELTRTRSELASTSDALASSERLVVDLAAEADALRKHAEATEAEMVQVRAEMARSAESINADVTVAVQNHHALAEAEYEARTRDERAAAKAREGTLLALTRKLESRLSAALVEIAMLEERLRTRGLGGLGLPAGAMESGAGEPHFLVAGGAVEGSGSVDASSGSADLAASSPGTRAARRASTLAVLREAGDVIGGSGDDGSGTTGEGAGAGEDGRVTTAASSASFPISQRRMSSFGDDADQEGLGDAVDAVVAAEEAAAAVAVPPADPLASPSRRHLLHVNDLLDDEAHAAQAQAKVLVHHRNMHSVIASRPSTATFGRGSIGYRGGAGGVGGGGSSSSYEAHDSQQVPLGHAFSSPRVGSAGHGRNAQQQRAAAAAAAAAAASNAAFYSSASSSMLLLTEGSLALGAAPMGGPSASGSMLMGSSYPAPAPAHVSTLPPPVLLSAIPALHSKLASVQREKAAAEAESERLRLELVEARTKLVALENLHGELTVDAAVHLALAQGGLGLVHPDGGAGARASMHGGSRPTSRAGSAAASRPASRSTSRPGTAATVMRRGSVAGGGAAAAASLLGAGGGGGGGDATVGGGSSASHGPGPTASMLGEHPAMSSSRAAQLTAVAIKVTERDRLRKELGRTQREVSTLQKTLAGSRKEVFAAEDTINALARDNRLLQEQMRLADARYEEMRSWLDKARRKNGGGRGGVAAAAARGGRGGEEEEEAGGGGEGEA